jgi:hypothetical protein
MHLPFHLPFPLISFLLVLSDCSDRHDRTRAYRLKFKEWGLLRHLPKATRADVRARRAWAAKQREEARNEQERERESSGTVEPVSAAPSPAAGASSTAGPSPAAVPSPAPERAQTGGWPLVDTEELRMAEPSFMGMLGQAVE